MNESNEPQTPASDHDRTQEHGSAELALSVYLFLAAFAYVFATLGGVA